jgi:prepilin-type N-terminal cleavage/methylation domain-containing protein
MIRTSVSDTTDRLENRAPGPCVLPDQAGFTLLEVLVVIICAAILVLLIVAIRSS